MPGTRHKPAAAAPAQVTILSDWRALRPHEPAIEALHKCRRNPGNGPARLVALGGHG